MRFITFVGFLLISLAVQAQTFQASHFESQFDEKVSLTNETKWLIFSYSKDGGEWVKDAFDELSITDLQSTKWVYIADISKMPGLVTEIFALPKMRSYKFLIGLDQEGKITKGWPRQDESVTVIKLSQLNAEKTHFFKDQASLRDFLRTIK